MNSQKIIIPVFLFLFSLVLKAQDDEGNYITFNDRRNVVHGVYMGIGIGYGEIEGEDTYIGSFKVAYVANQQFEVGFLAKGLYSRQNIFNPRSGDNDDLFAGYAGFHLEPILFGKSAVSLSFPFFIGGGAVGYVDRDIVENEEDFDFDDDDLDAVFVLEPGVSALFNISRYAQIEAGVKYRFSSKIELTDSPIDRINGFSTEIGIKLGIFNMGRNRYKKQLD
ncbi:hypothetical protein [Flagellimonas allohymeniacidonis]|uniref:Outer membrane protein beta-barrel domain-containing protein n=1 Tax=Flagellimonas allohymeniacidonis TaxID=2517819 RepID=A0A4V2HSR4_9FLAO|nr:hypothetical protein [Allomuricauda hymeniacidonis]TAI48750.1 hypothetical protein EW142_02820 [Allomuricauda hymeniacidonis]